MIFCPEYAERCCFDRTTRIERAGATGGGDVDGVGRATSLGVGDGLGVSNMGVGEHAVAGLTAGFGEDVPGFDPASGLPQAPSSSVMPISSPIRRRTPGMRIDYHTRDNSRQYMSATRPRPAVL